MDLLRQPYMIDDTELGFVGLTGIVGLEWKTSKQE